MVTDYHALGNLSKIKDRLHVKFIGGLPCLDFVNTVAGRVASGDRGRDYADFVIRDKIAAYHDLLAWSLLAGSVDRPRAIALARLAARDTQAAAGVLSRALNLRESLYRIFKCAVEGWPPPPPDADILRRELSVARAHQRLTPHQGAFVWTFLERPAALDRILWPVVLSAAELLTAGDLRNVAQCGGEDCGWLFLDTSRNHRRQWCDMQDCGNRAKVKRFRARQPKHAVPPA